MTALVTLFTPTRNKPMHLREAYQALLRQTEPRWEWFIAMNSPDARTLAFSREVVRDPRVRVVNANPKTFDGLYPPAVMINTYYPTIKTKYIMFMADDDLLESDALLTLLYVLESNHDWDVAHGTCEVWTELESQFHANGCSIKYGDFWWEPTSWVGGNFDIGHGTGISPDCNLDGGQFMQTRRSYQRMREGGWELSASIDVAGHCDGVFMARLAEFARFHAVGKKVLTHRKTALSGIAKPLWGYLP